MESVEVVKVLHISSLSELLSCSIFLVDRKQITFYQGITYSENPVLNCSKAGNMVHDILTKPSWGYDWVSLSLGKIEYYLLVNQIKRWVWGWNLVWLNLASILNFRFLELFGLLLLVLRTYWTLHISDSILCSVEIKM